MTYTPTGGSDELSPELFNAIQEEAAQQLNTLNEVQSVEATESALQEEQQEESKDSSRPTRSSVGTKEKRDASHTTSSFNMQHISFLLSSTPRLTLLLKNKLLS